MKTAKAIVKIINGVEDRYLSRKGGLDDAEAWPEKKCPKRRAFCVQAAMIVKDERSRGREGGSVELRPTPVAVCIEKSTPTRCCVEDSRLDPIDKSDHTCSLYTRKMLSRRITQNLYTRQTARNLI